MARRDITGTIDSIGADFKRGMNRYNATTSFRRDGVTYFIEINDMYGTNVIATWWDNSDNGFGYNNYGDVYVNNPFNRMTGSFSPENIDDYIGVNSAYDRNLPSSLKKAIINRVKRYIDYDALNDVRRTESIKRESKSTMKLRISEATGDSYVTSVVNEIRKELKAMGYTSRQVSVRTKGAGYSDSIRITIKDVSIREKEIQAIADKYESIRYDEYSGEILSGGNLYIFVEYDHYAVENACKPYLEKATEIFDTTGDKTVFVMEKNGKELYYYGGYNGHDGQCFVADDAYDTRVPARSAYEIARAMMFFDAQN